MDKIIQGLTINVKVEGKEELEQLKEDLKEIESTLDRIIEKKKSLNSESKSLYEINLDISRRCGR